MVGAVLTGVPQQAYLHLIPDSAAASHSMISF